MLDIRLIPRVCSSADTQYANTRPSSELEKQKSTSGGQIGYRWTDSLSDPFPSPSRFLGGTRHVGRRWVRGRAIWDEHTVLHTRCLPAQSFPCSYFLSVPAPTSPWDGQMRSRTRRAGTKHPLEEAIRGALRLVEKEHSGLAWLWRAWHLPPCLPALHPPGAVALTMIDTYRRVSMKDIA